GDLAACDIDGDGDLDLVYTAETAGQLVVLRNAAGGFGIDQFIPVAGRPQKLVSGDFDDNGEVDFAVVTVAENDLAIVMQRGGAFETAAVALPVPPREIGAGQFTGGPATDLVVVVATSTADTVFLEGDG